MRCDKKRIAADLTVLGDRFRSSDGFICLSTVGEMDADLPPISPAHATFYRRRLTGVLSQINERCGLETVRRIVLAYGGCPLHVPATFRPDWQLAYVVGIEAAREVWSLLADYAGDKVAIPSGPFGARYKLQLHAMDMFSEGYSISLVASRTGLARSTVTSLKSLFNAEHGKVKTVHERPIHQASTQRRRKGLSSLAQGKTVDEVARELRVHVATVKGWQRQAVESVVT